ncbi:MAG: hypothetical protein KIT31_38670 [Deltaproteobacteria bacterium]|nr:hypothetical protein [Deltaproteobacteria bacterium]
MRTFLATLRPRTVLLAAWLVVFLHAYPGQMTTDSFDHHAEAQAGVYSDGHPPFTSLLWKLVEYVVYGGTGMLILQTATFLAGLYAVLRHTFAPRRAAWIASALFLFPPIAVPFAQIWKDCLMAGFLMLGIAGLASRCRWRRLAALAAFAVATAVRYNAFAATFPLVVLLFEWRPGLAWYKRYAIALAAWLAVTLAAFGANRAITDRETDIWYASLALYDLAGTLAHLDRDVPDAELAPILDGTGVLVRDGIQARASEVFSPRSFLGVISGERRMWAMPAYGIVELPAAQRDAIGRAWRAIVADDPGAYVRYRLAVASAVLGLDGKRASGIVIRREDRVETFAYAQHIPLASSPLQDHMSAGLASLAKVAPIFAPWMYALLALVAIALALATGNCRDVIAYAASGLAVEATLVFLASTTDYRYSHWLVVATALSLAILVARRARQPLFLAAASTQHSAASQASTQ